MKMNVYCKVLMFLFLASCQQTEFQSSSSTPGPAKETLLNFKKVYVGKEQSLEFVLLNTTGLPTRPRDIEFQGPSLESSFFPNRKTLKSNSPTVVRIENINCPDLLEPKQSCKVKIIFKPKEAKKYELNFALNFNLKEKILPIGSLKILGEGIPNETISILFPVKGAFINSTTASSFSVSGACNINGAVVTLKPTSTTTTCTSGSFSKKLNLSSQAEGNVTITASIKNSVGKSFSSSVTVVKDTKGPQVKIGASSPSKVGVENPVTFSVTYTGASSVNLTSSKVALTGKTAGCVMSVSNGTTKTPTIKLSECTDDPGKVTVQIQKGTAQDVAGNLALASNLQSVPIKDSFVVVYRISSDDMNLELPLESGFNYNFKVDWGDGTPVQKVTSANDSDKTHTYAATGDYTVIIRGIMERYGVRVPKKIISEFKLKDFYRPYQSKIRSVPNLGDVGWEDLSGAFFNAVNLTTVKGGYTSKVTDMAYMFYKASQVVPDTSGWDISNVTDIFSMFREATQADPNTSGWNTSKVTDMAYMFHKATQADPDTSRWDTSEVIDMRRMFSSADQADPDVSKWDTSKVTSMYGMFSGADQANPDVSRWNTSKVTNMYGMFSSADQADPDVSKWDTSSVTDMGGMFSLVDQANPDVSRWDTSKVTRMSGMFSSAAKADPDVSGWDTSKVTDMWGMFFSTDQAGPNTSGWDTSKVIDMSYMFYGAAQADPDVSGWDTSNVARMEWMFSNAVQADPDVSRWNTSNVIDMEGMFSNAVQADPDVSRWDTSSVTTMSYMFHYAAQADPDVSKWNTSKVTRMSKMFFSADQADPDVSKWDTSKVTNMWGMFYKAARANPDTSGWSLGSISESSGKNNYESGLFQFFSSSNYNNLTTINYSTLLIKLANSQAKICLSTSPACSLNVGNVKYSSSAQSARSVLINNGWIITDGGLAGGA